MNHGINRLLLLALTAPLSITEPFEGGNLAVLALLRTFGAIDFPEVQITYGPS
jgi:hypothetical protein